MVEATLSSTFHNTNNNTDAASREADEKKKPSSVAIFQDAITVNIPIGVTADLGVAMRRTRTKRIEALYQAYPDLKEKDGSGEEEEEEEEEDDEEGEGESDAAMEGEGEPKKKRLKVKKDKQSQKKQAGLGPQRQDFGSIMDYLEAKYVRGVMIQNEKDTKSSKEDEEGGDDAAIKKAKEDEDDEGQGSVYSESSFLDDRDLQRDVAEQVLAQTTTTKLELEGDDDFFVNVGDLDVEETELTQQHYDPLEDSQKTKPAPKKRKKPSGDSAAAKKTTTSPPAKKKAAVAKKKKDDKEMGKANEAAAAGKKKTVKKKVKAASKKPKAKEEEKDKDDGNDSDSSSEGAVAVAAGSNKKTSNKKNTNEMKAFKAEADKHRAVMGKRFNTVKKMIKALSKEQLPRRPPLKSKVSITCPANKQQGDEVTFANPHIPGQRLRVQVPKGTFAGETFKVTVPVPKPSAGDDDEGVDHNKFPRELQDELDMYAREYDVFCKHEGEWRHAKDEEYPIHLEKRKKYDQVVKEFPKNLMTPIDSEYMKKLVRRARQNKSKRTKSAAVRRQSGDAAAASPAPTPAQQPDKAISSPQQPPQAASDNEQETADQSDAEEEDPPAPEPPTHKTIDMPEQGVSFPEKQFSTMDFFHAAGGQS